MLKTTPSLTVKSSTTGHSKSSTRDVRAAHEVCDGALVAGPHGVDDVEAVADEAGRNRVRIDRGVLRRAAAEDPIPAAAQGQRRVRHPAVRAGVAEADQRPDLARVVGLDAKGTPGDRVVGGARRRSAEEVGTVHRQHLDRRVHEGRRHECEGVGLARSRLTTSSAAGGSRGTGSRVRSRNAVTSHGTRIVSAAAWTSASVMSARRGRVAGDDRQRHVDLGDRGRSRNGRRRRRRRRAGCRAGARRGWARLVAQAGAQEDRHADHGERH